jgi:hypothetical protein
MKDPSAARAARRASESRISVVGVVGGVGRRDNKFSAAGVGGLPMRLNPKPGV